jgi:hypothetical protein
MSHIRMFDGLAPQKRPAVSIRDRQRVATAPVLAPKPSFEISTPNQIRALGMLQRFAVRRRFRPSLLRHSQTMPSHDLPDRAGRRPLGPRSGSVQPRSQLHRAPVGMLSSRLHYRVLDPFQHLTGVMMWRVRAILQRMDPPRFVPAQPFVPRLPADFEAPTNLGHAPFLALAFLDELQALIHHRTLRPAHTSLFGNRRKFVNTVYGLFCYQSHRRFCYHSRRSVPGTRQARVLAPVGRRKRLPHNL